MDGIYQLMISLVLLQGCNFRHCSWSLPSQLIICEILREVQYKAKAKQQQQKNTNGTDQVRAQ